MLNFYEEHRGNLAMKFCEKTSYCKELINDNIPDFYATMLFMVKSIREIITIENNLNPLKIMP